jgi:hypothetical protein
VTSPALREAARNGIAVALAEQLDSAWTANRGISHLVSGALLLSLPLLAVVFG